MTDIQDKVVSTGYTELDKLLDGGLRNGELIMTTEDNADYMDVVLLLSIAENVCNSGGSVLFFSFAKTKDYLLKKMKEHHFNSVNRFVCIDDMSGTLSDIRTTISALLNHVNLVCIDTLNYIHTDEGGLPSDNYVNAYNLSNMAALFNIPIMSSFIRSQDQDKNVSILRFADIILNITARAQNDKMKISVNRQYHIPSIELKADCDNWRFDNI